MFYFIFSQLCSVSKTTSNLIVTTLFTINLETPVEQSQSNGNWFFSTNENFFHSLCISVHFMSHLMSNKWKIDYSEYFGLLHIFQNNVYVRKNSSMPLKPAYNDTQRKLLSKCQYISFICSQNIRIYIKYILYHLFNNILLFKSSM